MDKENLCPFCGYDDSEVRNDMGWYWVRCCCCECQGPVSPTKKRAWEIWNKRSGAVSLDPYPKVEIKYDPEDPKPNEP